jgi:hypothetical protein
MRSSCVKRGGAQAPLDPVTLDGVADPLRNRKAEAQPRRISLPQSALNRHSLAMKTAARSRRDELCSFRQSPDVLGARAAHRGGALSRQALAASGATRGDNAAAALGGHAGAKAVTALANELAGLIGPLHGLISITRAGRRAPAPVAV